MNAGKNFAMAQSFYCYQDASFGIRGWKPSSGILHSNDSEGCGEMAEFGSFIIRSKVGLSNGILRGSVCWNEPYIARLHRGKLGMIV